MFNKFNFNSYFILATLLALLLGLYLDLWGLSTKDNYINIFIGLNAITLGLYCLFIENEVLNTSEYYQVFVIALVTGWQTISFIGYVIDHIYHVKISYHKLIWGILALIIHSKFPNFLVRINRFCIGYSFFHLVVRGIQCTFLNCVLIHSILALSFIFISYLNFDRLSALSSLTFYYYLLAYGINNIISTVFTANYHYEVYMISNILAGFLLVSGLFIQRKELYSKVILLGDNQVSYNSIESQTA